MNRPKIHKIEGQIQNIYFAEYPDRILMLDGACRADLARIESFFEQTLKRPVSDIKLIVSTHMHPDHAGGAYFLRKKYGISIAAFHKADKWYQGKGGFLQHLADVMMSWIVMLKSGKKVHRLWHPRFLKPNYRLFDNNVLPFFYDWYVVHTPGHTDHDICLYHAQSKLLYLADLIVRINKKCLLPFPIVFPDLLTESLQKISTLDVDTYLLAHGEMCEEAVVPDFFKLISEQTNRKLKGQFRFLNLFVKLSRSAGRR